MRRLGILVAAITLVAAAPASAAEINVTGTADPGVCPSDTSCTGIRSALVVANRLAGPDTIIVRDGTHQLLANAGGALAIISDVTIRGAGARVTSVVGSGTARVFSIGSVTATIAGLTMAGGQVPTNSVGGNLDNLGGNVTLDHVRVTGGVASGGGGVANENGTMTIQFSLIDGNTLEDAEAAGGAGILNLGNSAQATLAVRDSTITGNDANLVPGGAIVSTSPNLSTSTTLERATVVRNSADSSTGGLVFMGPGSFTVRQSIVDDNTTGTGTPVESNCGSSAITSGGGNIAGTAPIGTPQCAFAAGGDALGADPLLSAGLVNAGGQTDVLTIAPNSPAVNRAGSCSGADQRDLPRPQGGACDSGAFEVDQPPDTQLVAAPPTFTFSSSEPGVRFECRLDRPTRTGTPFACSSPASFPDLPPGSYTFVVRAIDGAGQGDPSPATAAFAVQTPRPNAGRTVVVNRVRGKVLVKVPGGKFVDLSRLTEIPDGSTIDTRKGVVVLVFEPRPGAKTQKAKFWDGLFKLDQRKRIMELVLVEKLAKCKQGDASSAARRKRARRLWGDGRGRFRTKGQYSSATVRGTKWLTRDTCAGTRTIVRKGKVDVRDFVRKKTIRLKKGQGYLARP